MKSVCIVGAGPAGLVSAKTLHQTGKFKVVVFEKGERLGGIWAYDKTASDPHNQQGSNSYLSPHTPTNLSKFTVGFSDLSWQTVGEREGWPNVPMFPKAWQVGRYLEHYATKNLPDGTIQYGVEVISAERQNHGEWHVSFRDRGHQMDREFDLLVVASGFFSAPKIPDTLRLPEYSKVRGIHSSVFRSLSDLCVGDLDANMNGKKILVIGGGNSGGEVAAKIAFQLSSSQHSAHSNEVQKEYLEGYHVVHVTARPLYGLPPFVQGDNVKKFMPIDVKFYDLSTRADVIIESGAGKWPQERINLIHGVVSGMTGENPHADFNKPDGEQRGAPYVALSEGYSEYVRSGKIVAVSGRILKFTMLNDVVTATITHNGEEEAVSSIAAVVYATGYSPATALQFLDDKVLGLLEYDPTNPRLPLILQHHQTLNPSVHDLGFVGWYEGPYWGVMEMQSRLLSRLWTSRADLPMKAFEQPQALRDLRKAIKHGDKDVPQYWFGDYLGYMEECARELKLQRSDKPFKAERDGPVSPARYLDVRDDHAEAEKIRKELYATLEATAKGKSLARAVFRGLQGHWTASQERSRSSYASCEVSGTSGKMTFHPRIPTDDEVDLEYLCLVLYDQNSQLMSQVYKYSEHTDKITIQLGGDEGTGELLTFEIIEVAENDDKESGTCSFALRSASGETVGRRRFALNGVNLQWWSQEDAGGRTKWIYHRAET